MIYFYYRIRFRQFFLNQEGLKSFAERCKNVYAGMSTKRKVSNLTSYVKILKEEHEKHSKDFIEYSKLDRMDNSSFSIKKSKSKRVKFLVYVLILFEIFLNYLSTLIILEGDSFLLILARWAISIGVALITMLTFDSLLTKLLPEESVKLKGTTTERNEDDEYLYKRTAKSKRIVSLILLPIVLIAFEILIIGISNARAIDIEGGTKKGVLYYGFILFSMALPIIAGYFKWDSEQHGKLYKNTLQYHRSLKLMHIVNLAIISAMKDIKTIIEDKTSTAWRIFSRFKLYKENYNRKRDISESTLDHYCKSLELFSAKILDSFGDEVKEILIELQAIKK